MIKPHRNLYYQFTKKEHSSNKELFTHLFLKEGGRASSCWFSNLPVNISNAIFGKYIPSIFKFYSYIHKLSSRNNPQAITLRQASTLATIKLCPGVHGILDNCVLVCSPCDIQITVFSTGTWLSNDSDSELVELVEEHPASQFATFDPSNNIFANNVVIKFKMPLTVGTDGGSYVYMQPQYHNNLDIKVINGVIHGDYTKNQPLNVVTVVDIPLEGEKEITIKRGDVLAYIWGEEPLKLKYREKSFIRRHSKFLGHFIDIPSIKKET